MKRLAIATVAMMTALIIDLIANLSSMSAKEQIGWDQTATLFIIVWLVLVIFGGKS